MRMALREGNQSFSKAIKAVKQGRSESVISDDNLEVGYWSSENRVIGASTPKL